MASYDKVMESYKKAVTTAASVAASVMLVRGVVNELVPDEVRDMLFSGLSNLRSRLWSQHMVVIDETEGWASNRIYDAVETYLATRINTDMECLRISHVDEEKSMMISITEGEEMTDVYDGAQFKWRLVCHDKPGRSNNSDGNGNNGPEVRSFQLRFHMKHKEKALKSYVPFIMATAKAIRLHERTLKIYMNEYESWSPVDLRHPSTFDTLAMDQKLLYGPPGTGKSSLIAAMANYLKFDIYDLELTEVSGNSSLRRLLIGMTNRSILVVEDIDCTIELQHREEGQEQGMSKPTDGENNSTDDKVTLSGLLNFVDGLWSTCGEERIIIFTTNYKERLDPALLRPGRMDMHIHMGYCTPESFRILASNYHSIDYHVKYPEIEELIKEVTVSPAEVAEVLMRNDEADVALQDLSNLSFGTLVSPKLYKRQQLYLARSSFLQARPSSSTQQCLFMPHFHY